jgi:hypothetical protein
MRPKIVITVLLVGFIGLAGIFFLKHLAAPSQPGPSVPPAIASQAIAPTAPPVSPVADNPAPAKPAATIIQVTTVVPRVETDTNAQAEEHEAYVNAETEKLTELQANDNADSLHAILADLTNSDREIRDAAVESTIQFGSRDAIPVLKDLAARTQDPDEKKELQDAADFLALPTMEEVHAQIQQAKKQNTASPVPGQP